MVKVANYFWCMETLYNGGGTGKELIDFYSKIFLSFLFLFKDSVHFDIEYNNREDGVEYNEKISKSTSFLLAEINIVFIFTFDEAYV